MPNLHGFSALFVFSSVAARFFPPQIGGAGATVGAPGVLFRIDHDGKFNQTTHFQYQPWKLGPWVGFNWRYDSGLVAGDTPCYGVTGYNDCPQSTTLGGQPAILLQDVFGNPLSADQEYEAGLACNGVRATPTFPSFGCVPGFRSRLISPNCGDPYRERRPRTAAHRLAQSVRCFLGRRQSVQGRPAIRNVVFLEMCA